jgi:hypothetical protein
MIMRYACISLSIILNDNVKFIEKAIGIVIMMKVIPAMAIICIRTF